MEWLTTIIGVFLVVMLVGAAFAVAGARGPAASLVGFFAILFVATLAIGVWVEPVGPRVWGFPWLGFLVTTLLLALMIVALTPSPVRRIDPKRRSTESGEPDVQPAPVNPREAISSDRDPQSDGAGAATAVGIFFWLFVIFALIVFAARVSNLF